jgi:hypothetical protein
LRSGFGMVVDHNEPSFDSLGAPPAPWAAALVEGTTIVSKAAH